MQIVSLDNVMQIVSLGDNLHEMLYPIFWEKKKFKMLSAEFFT